MGKLFKFAAGFVTFNWVFALMKRKSHEEEEEYVGHWYEQDDDDSLLRIDSDVNNDSHSGGLFDAELSTNDHLYAQALSDQIDEVDNPLCDLDDTDGFSDNIFS